MPTKPKIPCKHPGCPSLVLAGEQYCNVHKALHQQEQAQAETRSNSNARGYNRRWQKARLAFLHKNPLCVRCKQQGRFVRATVVDHIIPHRGNQKLFWDQSNWQALCKQCHDRKTMKEDKPRGKEYKY